MNIKTLFFAITCMFSFSLVNAQDELYKKNGDLIEAKVIEVGTKVITYQKAGNPEGPVYKINKDDIARIVYANGSDDVFAAFDTRKDRETRSKKNYGNNIIGFMPMQITSNVGVGLSYERVLDKNGILSFYMPVTIAFENNNSYDPYYGPIPVNGGNNPSPTFYIMPGLKFYPTGGKGVVRYSVGPNLTYISGKSYRGTNFIYDNNGNIIGQDLGGWSQRTALGIMVTNGLNINPTSHLHLGLELGLGFTYFDQANNQNLNTDAIAQFGFKIGYRF